MDMASGLTAKVSSLAMRSIVLWGVNNTPRHLYS